MSDLGLTDGKHRPELGRRAIWTPCWRCSSGGVPGGVIGTCLIAIRRTDLGEPGHFNETLDELIEEFQDDPDRLLEAADRAGLRDEVDARLAVHAFDV